MVHYKGTTLITGGTGFIGGRIADYLLNEKSHRVIFLTRDKKDKISGEIIKAEDRAREKLYRLGLLSAKREAVRKGWTFDAEGFKRDFTANFERRKRDGEIIVINADLAQMDPKKVAQEVKEKLEEIDPSIKITDTLHAGAMLSMDEARRKQVEATNIGGTENLVNALEKLAENGVLAEGFGLTGIGTCYKRREGSVSVDKTNVYETSKWKASVIMRTKCRENNWWFDEVNPDIVVGPESDAFGLMYFQLVIAENYEIIAKFLNEGGKVTIPGNKKTKLSISLIDDFMDAFQKVFEREGKAGVDNEWNIANPHPPSLQEGVIWPLLDAFGLKQHIGQIELREKEGEELPISFELPEWKGKMLQTVSRISPNARKLLAFMRKLEARLKRGFTPLYPYVSGEGRTFDTKPIAGIYEEKGERYERRPITVGVYRKMLWERREMRLGIMSRSIDGERIEQKWDALSEILHRAQETIVGRYGIEDGGGVSVREGVPVLG